MAYTHAFLWQLAKVVIPAVAFGLSVWQRHRKPNSISIIVPFGIAVVLGLMLTVFVRQAVGIHRLRHLRAESVSSISYNGKTYSDPGQVVRLVDALRDSYWWSERSSAMTEQAILSIHFKEGNDWTMVVGGNRYGEGTIIRMADREFSRGYALNPALGAVLRR